MPLHKLFLSISLLISSFTLTTAQINESDKIKSLNNYVNFSNESTHGLLIVHRLLENFNKNINKFVDLPDQQINFYSNKDLPQDIFEDPENWFYDVSPNEWYEKINTSKSSLPPAVESKLKKTSGEMKSVISSINNIRFELEDQIKKLDLTKRENLVNCWEDNINITLGKSTEEGGKYAYLALDRALNDIKAGNIDAIVTAPINKSAMQMAKFPFPGHTEYFTSNDETGQSIMLLVSDALKVALVTNHIPLSNVSSVITKELIIEKIKILNKTLIQDFGYEKPVISVLGLNPHASDDSVIGDEEEKIIRPAIVELKKQGIMVAGPYPADGFFGSSLWKKSDAVLAMYHDQGLIPFKALTFGSGTNVTAGLSFIRTSSDHGTAFDIAGTNSADESSMLKAIYTAVDMVNNRREYFSSRENALVRREKQSAGIHE